LHAEVDGGPAYGAAAAAVRAHPERNLTGVAVDDLDVFHRQTQLVGRDLRERRLVPLPVRVRSGEDGHLSRRVHAYGRALVEARLRSERAGDLRRRQTAGLDIRGETNAQVAPHLAQPVLLPPKRAVVEHLQRLVERRFVVAAVVEEGDRRLVREGVLGNEVPAADLDGI